jgi:hypothetical protein
MAYGTAGSSRVRYRAATRFRPDCEGRTCIGDIGMPDSPQGRELAQLLTCWEAGADQPNSDQAKLEASSQLPRYVRRGPESDEDGDQTRHCERENHNAQDGSPLHAQGARLRSHPRTRPEESPGGPSRTSLQPLRVGQPWGRDATSLTVESGRSHGRGK